MEDIDGGLHPAVDEQSLDDEMMLMMNIGIITCYYFRDRASSFSLNRRGDKIYHLR